VYSDGSYQKKVASIFFYGELLTTGLAVMLYRGKQRAKAGEQLGAAMPPMVSAE
jgi:hypothetical protein